MSTEVAVRNRTTGIATFYSNYDAARSAASSGDLIQIYASIDAQIWLKDGVDILITPGTIVFETGGSPTITDNGYECTCNIYGFGIIKNTYPGQDCIKISNSGSVVNITCDYIEGYGADSDTTGGPCVNVEAAAKFSLFCNNIISKFNSAIVISDCDDIFIQCKKVISGTAADPNTGAPVVSLEASGVINVEEIICNGYGSCFVHKKGIINSSISKFTTNLTDDESPPAASSTLLLDGGDGTQDLVLYFDTIQNVNPTDGDAVTITEGKATLIGNHIYSAKGLSLDLKDDIVSAFIQCGEIISVEQGINISNSDEQIIIEANYIEGSDGNDGVIRSASGSKYLLRNARIKNTTESSPSIGIYIPDGSADDQFIELENLIIFTGNDEGDFSIFRAGSNNIHLKNLGLFVRVDRSEHVPFLIGDDGNYKYIINDGIA